VKTQRGYINWIPDSTSSAGYTSCWTPLPPPPPPPCGGGAGNTEIFIFPLDGRISPLGRSGREMPAVRSPTPLTRFERVGGESFFLNEHLIAEKDPVSGSYVAASASGSVHHVVEALQEIEANTPHRRFAPERMLAVTVAQHAPPQKPTPVPAVRFPAVPQEPSEGLPRIRSDFPPNRPPQRERPSLFPSAGRFAVQFDIRDTLGLPRVSTVLWSDGDVPAAWIKRLASGIVFEPEELSHRLIVYAVVETGNGSLHVTHQKAVLPQCCCGEQICP